MVIIKIDEKSYSKLLNSVTKSRWIEEVKMDVQKQDRLDQFVVYNLKYSLNIISNASPPNSILHVTVVDHCDGL